MMNSGAMVRVEKRRDQVLLQKTVEKYGIPANVEEMRESGDTIQLKRPDGSTEFNVMAQNDHPWHPKEKMHMAYFILPRGYARYAFSLDTSGNTGDIAEAYWASDDPNDARIVLHVKTSRCLKAHNGLTASIYNVFGKKKNSSTV